MILPYAPGTGWDDTAVVRKPVLQRLVDSVRAETTRRPTVLLSIADDALRGESRRLLQGSQFQVVEPPDGDLPAEAVRRLLPDVVLADMRTLDGWSGVRRLRLDPHTRGVPVIGFVSALREEDHFWARQYRVDCLVPVPFDVDSLLDLVERITGG